MNLQTRRRDSVGAPRPLGVIEHIFSHRRERYHCFAMRALSVTPDGRDVAWIDEDDDTRALPRAQQRIRSMALVDEDGRHTKDGT